MWMLFSISLAFAAQKTTCTQPEIKNAICWALCRRDGFDTGSFMTMKKSCLCSNYQAFEEFTSRTIKIHSFVQTKMPEEPKEDEN